MKYRAFFSYARADDKIASWLWGRLDRYRTPKDWVGTEGKLGPTPEKLHPIFRDRTDLGSGGQITAELQGALEDSERLIVLCTPTSAKSFWVNHEVETFLRLGRENRIFPTIAAGEPDSGNPEAECFPPALRGKALLAADLREIKLPTGQMIGDGRDSGSLKLIAGLLGLPLDALVRRERRRQRILMTALAIAATLFAVVAGIAALQTVIANRNEGLAADNAQRATINAEVAEHRGRDLARQLTGQFLRAGQLALALEVFQNQPGDQATLGRDKAIVAQVAAGLRPLKDILAAMPAWSAFSWNGRTYVRGEAPAQLIVTGNWVATHVTATRDLVMLLDENGGLVVVDEKAGQILHDVTSNRAFVPCDSRVDSQAPSASLASDLKVARPAPCGSRTGR